MRGFVLGMIAGISAAAVSQELRKAPEARTWKGQIGGIPYNFRVDEWQHIAQEYWNPASDQILTKEVIGVGWGLNLAALTRKAQTALDSVKPATANQRVIDATPTTNRT